MPKVPDTVIFIGADHRGYDLAKEIAKAISDGRIKMPEGYVSVSEYNGAEKDPNDDFNDAAMAVSAAVLQNPGSFGILVCGSAHGIAMQANRFKGVRAIAAYSEELAKKGREHNDANILCLSADFTDEKTNFRIVEAFFATEFAGEERFIRRNQRLDEEFGL